MSLRQIMLLTLLLGLSACVRNSPPIHFYMLKPIETSRVMTKAPAGAESPVIGLGPIRVAAYLDRPQMVTALSSQEYKVAEDRRWGEPLSDAVPRVLAENLSNLIPTDKIVLYPWPSKPKVDVQIGVNILEFHEDDAGQVRLTALWTVKVADKEISQKKFTCRQPAPATDYAMIAAAQSECLARFSREITMAVHSLKAIPRSIPSADRGPAASP